MLQLLRKYQRFFLAFVTVMIIASFSFFGTFSVIMGGSKEVEDPIVGRTVGGSVTRRSEMESIKRLISHSEAAPHLLSDQFFLKELLQPGLVHLIADHYFAELEGDFKERLGKIKHYRPYAHPGAGNLNAKNIWAQFAPNTRAHLEMIQNYTGETSREAFGLLLALYQDQAAFPPEMLRRVLLYFSQSQRVQPDPYLEQGSLSLFGFESLEDWFGQKFVDLVVRVVINAAAVAKQHGCEISYEEARAELFNNVYQALKIYNNQSNIEEAGALYHQQIATLGLDEKHAVEAWRSIVAAKSFLNDQPQALLIDPYSFESFAHFAGETIKLEQYALPEEFLFRDPISLLEFQTYLEAIAGKYKGDLPKHALAPEEIEKKYPELVQELFEIEYRQLNIHHLAQKIALKETWDWETTSTHFERLIEQFPELDLSFHEILEGRCAALEHLLPVERLKVDEWARLEMVKEQPELFEIAFDEAPLDRTTISFRLKGGSLPFQGVEDRRKLKAILMQDGIQTWSGDQVHFYRIHVVKRPQHKEVLLFRNAKADRVLAPIVSKKLETLFPEIYHNEGERAAAERLVSDLFKQSELSYSRKRFEFFMHEAKGSILEKGEESPFLQRQEVPELCSQWLLKKSVKELKRSDLSIVQHGDLFDLLPGTWTDVFEEPLNALAFCHILEHTAGESIVTSLAEKGKEALIIDAKRELVAELLKDIDAV